MPIAEKIERYADTLQSFTKNSDKVAYARALINDVNAAIASNDVSAMDLPAFKAQVISDIQELTGLTHQYHAETRRVTTVLNADELQILAVGCTGKEPELQARFPSVFNSWNARAKVAKGMELAANDALDDSTKKVATLTLLLGDQGYSLPVDVNDAVFTPYADQENVFCVTGNHELDCEGHGTTVKKAMAYRAAYVSGIQEKSLETAQFYMPGPYYSQIIQHATTRVYHAFLVYVDTSLLAIDTDQQTWLHGVCVEFDRLDPIKKIPRFFVGHHGLYESIDKRGIQDKEGKKYANPDAHSGNHHQLLAATLTRLTINMQDYLLLAAHIHQTAIHVANDFSSELNVALVQVMAGGGGSYSNTGDSKIIPQGLVFNENGFGYVKTQVPASASEQKITISYHNCDEVNLSQAVTTTQMVTMNYTLEVDYRNKTVDLPLGVILSKSLLKNQQSTIDFLCTVVTLDKPQLLLWQLLAECQQELAYYKKTIDAQGLRENSFTQLLTCINLTEAASAVTLLTLQVAVQACLTQIVKEYYIEGDNQAHFLKKDPFKRSALSVQHMPEPWEVLYSMLLTYKNFLAQWQVCLAKSFNKAQVLSVLQAIYVAPRHKEPTTEVARFTERNADRLHDDYDPNVLLVQNHPLEVANETSISATQMAAFVSVAEIRQRYNGGDFSLSPTAKAFFAQQLRALLSDSTLLTQVMKDACYQYINSGWTASQGYVNAKKSALVLLPFIAQPQEQLTLMLEALLATEHSPEALLLTLFHGISAQNPAVDFRATVLDTLATFINVALEQQVTAGYRFSLNSPPDTLLPHTIYLYVNLNVCVDDSSQAEAALCYQLLNESGALCVGKLKGGCLLTPGIYAVHDRLKAGTPSQALSFAEAHAVFKLIVANGHVPHVSAQMVDLIKLLRTQKTNLYSGCGEEADQGRQQECMKKILVEFFEQNKLTPLYQTYLTPEFYATLWTNNHWRQQLLITLVPSIDPVLLQFLAVLWQQEPSTSWLEQAQGMFTAPTETLAQQLANCVIQASTSGEFLILTADQKFASLQTVITFIADAFEICKAQLYAAFSQGWLPHLARAIGAAKVAAGDLSERPTVIFSPLEGHARGVSSMINNDNLLAAGAAGNGLNDHLKTNLIAKK